MSSRKFYIYTDRKTEAKKRKDIFFPPPLDVFRDQSLGNYIVLM